MSAMNTTFPFDATGQVLRALSEHGSDMSRPMKIKFEIEYENPVDLTKIEKKLSEIFGDIESYFDEEDSIWTAECTKEVIPDYSAIVALEDALVDICLNSNCTYAGFGSFGNSEQRVH